MASRTLVAVPQRRFAAVAVRSSTRRRSRRARRPLRLESLETRLLLAADWQNPFYTRDVTDDGVVTANDALVAINQLNSRAILADNGDLPDRAGYPDRPYYDVTGDGKLVPNDVLIVINALNGDTVGPTITVALVQDTAPGGATNDDRVTANGMLSGRVLDDFTGINSLLAQMDGLAEEAVTFARDGTFTLDTGLLPDGSGEGQHTVRFRAADGRANAAEPVDFTFTFDSVAPAAPTGFALHPSSDGGASQSDGVTNDNTPTVQGDAASGNTITVRANGAVVGTGVANSPWSITTTALADGLTALTAIAEDAAGNASAAAAVLSFVIDTAAPTASSDLTGTLRRTFSAFDVNFSEPMAPSALDSASYGLQVVGGANDGQVIAIGQVDAFPDNQVFLNLGAALADQGYRFSVSGALTDIAGNPLAGTTMFDFSLADPPGIASISPGDGATHVGVTRETVVQFDEPIDPATITADALHLIAKGERVAGRIVPSSTERFVTFFYDDALPPSTEVRVVVDGDLIRGRDGRLLDADGDDLPGGETTADFSTLALTRVPDTELFGYVYDAANIIPQESVPIPVPSGDPFFDPAGTGTQTIAFKRAEVVPGSGTSAANPRQFLNKVTSFIDASMVYGSDESRARALRALDGTGRLKTSPGDHLPLNNVETFPNGPLEMGNEGPMPMSDMPVAGDVRAGEVPTLSAMHTLWLREHNRYALELKAANPRWTDDQLYEAARRWVGGLIQHISYQEFLPAILGPAPLPDYTGYNATVDPNISALFSTAAFRLGHTLQSGSIQRLGANGQSLPGGPLPVREAFFNPYPLRNDGLDAYLRGMVAGRAQEFDPQVIDDLRNFLFGPPGAGGLDLVSINIQRGRDLGLPDYNQARADRGLPRVTSFAQITSDATVAAALLAVYGDVDKIDAWVGGVSEDPVPGGVVGPLFAAIIRDQFQRSRDGDRFWYENGQFSEPDLTAIRATRLSDVIARNSGVTGLPANVFTTGAVNAGSGIGGASGTPTETRSFDGYGNNETDEHLGEAKWPLRVDYTVSFGDGIGSLAGADRPGPRTISNALSAQSDNTVNSAGLTDIAITWGQFLDHDLVLSPAQTEAGTNIPVEGATIRVDAFPEANVVTDAQGFFELEDMPAPEFFVHIDGTTALNAPPGTTYPSVGKPFHALPGQRTQLNMAGMPFNVYLPPMATADITPLSSTQPTDVGFGDAGLDELEQMLPDVDADEWQKLQVTFAPGAAVDAQGAAATQAVVIPVPPERLPAPLPPGVDPRLVISIQAPGATNFDIPAAITYPNLDNLPIGEHATLFSFDHDIGMFVPVGTMEVVADGNGGTILVSDPGVGIVAPGWHYVTDPLNWSGSGGPPEGNKPAHVVTPPAVDVRLFVTGETDELSLTFLPPPGVGQSIGDHPAPGGPKVPTREVTIEVLGTFDVFYDNTGPNGLRATTSGPLVLKPGDAPITKSATLRSLAQLLAKDNAGKPFDSDRVYGAKITVTEKVTLADGSTHTSSRIILPYLVADQADENGADKLLKFRNAIHASDFFSARSYRLDVGTAPVPFFEFSGAAASEYSDTVVAGDLALKFNPGAAGARPASMTVRANVNGQDHRSTKLVSVTGEGTAGTVIHLNKMAAVDNAMRVGKMEPDAMAIYDAIKQHLESIIRDLGVAAQTAITVDDADMGEGRAVNVLWNFANDEFIDRNGNNQLDNPEIDDRDNDGVFGETGGDFIDFNRDGVADVLIDANGDGMPDDVTGDGMVTAGDFVDRNNDGVVDAGEYLDSDGDGNPTVAELGDVDGDGRRGETRGEYIDFNRNGRADAGETRAGVQADIDGNGVVDVAGDYIDYNNNTRFDTDRLLGRAFTGVDFATTEFGEKLVTNQAQYGKAQQAFIFDTLFDRGAAGSFELMIDNIIGTRNNAAAGVYGGITVAHEAFHTFGMVHSDNMGLGNFDIQNHTNPPSNRLTNGSRFAMRTALDLTVSANELLADSIPAFRRGYANRNNDPPAFPLFSDPVVFEGPSFALLTTDLTPLHEQLDFGPVTADGPGGELQTINILLQNPGDEPLVISSATLTHGDRGFAIGGFAPGLTIPPDGESALTLTFDPSAIGDLSDQLVLLTNATGSSRQTSGHFNPLSDSDPNEFDGDGAPPADGRFRYELSGRGINPQPVATIVLGQDGNNNLGGVELGDERVTVFLSVTNDGAAPLTFTPTIVEGQVEYSLAALNGVPQTLAFGATLALPVTFRPSHLGLLPGLMRLTTNDPSRPAIDQGMIGTGVPAGGIGSDDFQWGNDFVRVRSSGVTHQVRSNDMGFFQVGLATSAEYDISVFDPVSGYLAMGAGTTGPSGAFTDITRNLTFAANASPDSDFDGLPDGIEGAIGSATNRRDTDGDGLTDWFEIQQGLDPLGGQRIPTGVIANLELPGQTNAVAVAGELIYVATGFHGLAIVDGSRFDNPILLGQLDLDGNATGIGVDSRLGIAAVATGAGLALVDVRDPMSPRLLRTVPIDAQRVLVHEGVAYAGVESDVSVVDLNTGEVLQTLDLSATYGQITGMARDGAQLFVYSQRSEILHVIDIALHDQIRVVGQVVIPIASSDVGIHAGNGFVWLAGSGLNSVDVRDPAHPVRVGQPSGGDFFAARRIALNGSGLGVMAPDFATRIEVFDVSDPSVVNRKVLDFALSGPAHDVAISRGVAYVGHGNQLAVVNYLPFDNLGDPPTVSISTPVADENPAAPGVQILEGTVVPIRVEAQDDMQVRQVELIVDGEQVDTDVSFPFDFTFVAPNVPTGGIVPVVVRATDTGGNVTTSSPLDIDLVPDTTPPTVFLVRPEDNSVRGSSFRTVRVSFSEPIDPLTVSADTFQLSRVAAPNDFVVPSDIQIRDHGQTVQFTYTKLPAGENQLVLNGAAIRDIAGNPLGADVVSRFTVLESTALWINPDGGNWEDPANWDGNQLPGPDDHVLINLPGNVTITHRSGDTQIQSLTSTNKFTLSGGTLDVATFVEVSNTFTLTGGTLQNATLPRRSGLPGLIVAAGAHVTLDHVTLDNNLRADNGANLDLVNGLVLNGTLTISNAGGTTDLVAQGSQTISGTGRIVLAGTSNSFRSRIVTNADETLTLGPDLAVGADVGSRIGTAGILINHATITANHAAATTTILGTSITNDGTFEVRAGTLTSDAVTNVNGGTLTGGIWRAGPGATLNVTGATVSSNQAQVVLDGTNARFRDGAGVDALAGLATNGAGAMLSLLGGATLTTTAGLTNEGELTIGAGSSLNVGGSFTQSDSATLHVGIDGPNQAGALAAAGAATLDGTLHLVIPTGADVQLSTFTPLTFSSRSGEFAAITGMPLGLPFLAEHRLLRVLLHFGATVPQAAAFPFTSNFQDGTFGTAAVARSNASGRVTVTSSNQPRSGTRHLVMESQPGTTALATNELIVPVSFTDASPVQLSFYHKSFDTSADPLPATFTGSVGCDGVAMSLDGIHWFRVADLSTATSAEYEPFTFDLRAIATAAGLTLTDHLFVKIQQVGAGIAPNGGRAFDDIRVAADAVGPRLVSVVPSGPFVFANAVSQLVATFNEPLAAGTATNAANYDLVGDGDDDVFGTSDDDHAALTPMFDGATVVTLSAPAALDPDVYRLTFRGAGTITDAAGAPLNDGLDWIVFFSVFPVESPTNDTRDTATDTGITDAGGIFDTRAAIGDHAAAGADIDVYRFAAAAGQFVRAAAEKVTVPGAAALDLLIRILDAAGTELATGNAANVDDASVSVRLPAAGVYFVEVTSAAQNPGLYQLSVSAGGNVAGFPFDEDFEAGPPLAAFWEISSTTTGRVRVTDEFPALGNHFQLVADTATPIAPWLLVHQDSPGPNTALEELGLIENVDYAVASPGQFATLTAAQIAAFDVVLVASSAQTDFGLRHDENNDTVSDLMEALAGAGTTGRAVLATLDADAVPAGGQEREFLRNALNWVRAGQTTGLVALHDLNFDWAWTPWFASLENHVIDDADYDVTIVNTNHAVMVGLTNAGLSNWAPSYAQFVDADLAGFLTLAIDASDATRRLVLALDGATENVPSEDRRPSLHEAVLHVDLTGQTNAELRFDAQLFDESESLADIPTMFTGSTNGTGVSLSVDGTTWFNLFPTHGFADQVVFHGAHQAADLDEIAAAHQLNLGDDVQIKFQYFGFGPAPHRGFAIDNVEVVADRVGPTVENISPLTFAPRTRPVAVAVDDLNGDSSPDIVTGNSGFGGAISLFVSAPGGRMISEYLPNFAARDVALGNIDGDTDLDVLALVEEPLEAGVRLIVLRNDGLGALSGRGDVLLLPGAVNIATGDVNGDSRLDVLIANGGSGGSRSVTLLLNDGAGGFLQPLNVNVPVMPRALAVADLNGDGPLDFVAVGTMPRLGTQLVTMLNTLAGGFNPFTFAGSTGVTAGATDVALGHLNGDTLLDAVAGGFDNAEPGRISVRPGIPGGLFGAGADYGLDPEVRAVELASIDADGDLDVVAVTGSGDGQSFVTVLLNDGLGNFPTLQKVPTGADSGRAAIRDMNGDSILDVITTSGEGGISTPFNVVGNITILNNAGDGTLTPGGSLVRDVAEVPQGFFPIDEFRISFDEVGRLDATTLADAGNYRVIEAGPDGLFDPPNDPTPDDRLISLLAPVVTTTHNGEQQVQLPIAPGELPLPTGRYRITVKGTSTIRDADGNPLGDADGDGIGADSSDTLTILENGPVLVSQYPRLDAGLEVRQIRLTFSEPIDGNTFTVEDITDFHHEGAAITPTSVTVVGLHATIQFPTQTDPGFYTFNIGPDIRDLQGNPLNPDFNEAFGEATDLATVNFLVTLSHFDEDGFIYDWQSADATLLDGGRENGNPLDDRFDSYNTAYRLAVGGASYTSLPDSATFEDAKRTIVFPDKTLAGLTVHREVYVPATGGNFARLLDVYHNPTASPIATTVTLSGSFGGLATHSVTASSSGDAALTTGDTWFAGDDAVDGDFAAELAHVMQNGLGITSLSAATFDSATRSFAWQFSITVNPGQTVRVLSFAVQTDGRASAALEAADLALLPPRAVANLSAEELASIVNFGTPQPLRLDAEPRAMCASGCDLSSVDAAQVRDRAIALWVAAGLDAQRSEFLRAAELRIVDLPGNVLGAASAVHRIVLLDLNAAGYGWFLDSTPADNRKSARAAGDSDDRVDLLTVLAHELGHLLGYDHVDDDHDLMSAWIEPGQSRAPWSAHVDSVFGEVYE